MLTLHLLMVLERSHNSRETREWVDAHLFLLHTDKARQRVLVIADGQSTVDPLEDNSCHLLLARALGFLSCSACAVVSATASSSSSLSHSLEESPSPSAPYSSSSSPDDTGCCGSSSTYMLLVFFSFLCVSRRMELHQPSPGKKKEFS